MQHYKYSTLKKLHINPDLSYFKKFLQANIKFLFTYPQSIWYSQRYNAGEKFILMDTNNFPYFYNMGQYQKETADPLNISLYLLTATTESYILNYPNLKPKAFSEKTIKKVSEIFNENFQNLNTLINLRLEDQKKLDLPVAVYARILYAGIVANSKAEVNKAEKNTINEDSYKYCLNSFLDKIEFADAESISMVLFSLANFGIFDENIWKNLSDNLKNKSFAPEFTHVTYKSPHVFRYEDVDINSVKSQYLDEFGNKMFLNGFLPVYQAFSSLNKAVEKGVNVGDVINHLLRKFPQLKDEIHKFNASI